MTCTLELHERHYDGDNGTSKMVLHVFNGSTDALENVDKLGSALGEALPGSILLLLRLLPVNNITKQISKISNPNRQTYIFQYP